MFLKVKNKSSYPNFVFWGVLIAEKQSLLMTDRLSLGDTECSFSPFDLVTAVCLFSLFPLLETHFPVFIILPWLQPM